jgi:small-conductance mechanosensitive channel
VDLQERYQLEMAARVQKVRKRARPWRSYIAAVLAIAGAVAARYWGVPTSVTTSFQRTYTGAEAFSHASPTQQIITVGGAAAFLIFGLAAVLGLSAKARSSLQPVVGEAHAAVVRYVLVLVGIFAILLITLDIGRVQVTQLLVGGAVVGVLLGIAAQQSLANLFAGLVLLFARPFRVGDRVRFRAGALSGTIEGVVVDISLTYVRLGTEDGPALVPNSQALAASVLLVPDEPDETGGATTN